ncbi:serine/threonine-protein kinase [Ferrimonas senticii]|uniref:serine/threonine-protein kinase n=1 Tax=Ferrimonas senticii TaxID=394566 RepID=UPI000407E376|nr:serine/threonine-protein kinase [Ferrimonas senticii]
MERTTQIKKRFNQALTVAPEHLSQWLEQVEPELRDELEGLLAVSDSGSKYFEQFHCQLFGLDEADGDDIYDLVGTSIGHYQIRRVIGHGGVGVVYEGWDKRLQREVAIKLLAPNSALSAVGRTGLLKEARITSRLLHRNIGTIYEVTQTKLGQDVIVMAFYPGQTLQQWLDSDSMTESQVRHWMRQLLAGLRSAHASDVVHRDIKPSNLMILPDNSLKILDFGAAVAAQADEFSHTVIGTTSYMSPEQIRGEELGPASDYWSAGVVLLNVAQQLGWIDKVNAFVWAQNPAASKQAGPEWVNHALLALLTVDADERLAAVAKLTFNDDQGWRRRRVKQTAVASMVVTGFALAAWLWSLQPQSLPQHPRLSIEISDTPLALEQALADDLDQWLKAIDANSAALSYLGQEWQNQPIAGENLAVRVNLTTENDGYLVELALKRGLLQRAIWQRHYSQQQRHRISADLRLQLADYLGVERVSQRLVKLQFQNPRAYELFVQAKALIGGAERPLNLDTAALEQAQAKLAASMQLESNPAAQVLKATVYRLQFEQLGSPSLLDSAMRCLNLALEQESQLLGAYLELAEIYTIKQEYGSALAAYQMAREHNPNHVDVLYGIVRTHLRQGNVPRAQRYLREFELVAPYDWRVPNLAGVLASERADYRQALKHFKQALALLPDDLKLRTNVANTLVNLGQVEQAQQQLQVIALEANDFSAYSHLGLLALNNGDFRLAVDSFQRALLLRPQDRGALSGFVLASYYRQPDANESLQSVLTQAIQLHQRAHQSMPLDLTTIESLALLHAIAGDHHQSKRYIAKLIDYSVPEQINHFALIESYEVLGERRLALQWLENWRDRGIDWRRLEHHPTFGDLRADEKYQKLKQGNDAS